MITDEFLVEKLRGIFNESLFNLEGYSIPKFATRQEGASNLVIDIEDFRNKQLEQKFYYPTTSNFKFALKNSEFLKSISFIEEFPIVILNRGLWESLNNTLSTKYKSCLFVDFFCPQYNLIVELDGAAFHSNNSNFELKIEQETKDRMRDAYCRMELGTNIIRLKSFGKYNEKKNNAEIKLLEKTIKSLQNNQKYSYSYNYEIYLLYSWKIKYNSELNFITWVEENYSKDVYNPNINSLTVTCSYSMYNTINQLLHCINDMFKLFFNKRLIVKYR